MEVRGILFPVVAVERSAVSGQRPSACLRLSLGLCCPSRSASSPQTVVSPELPSPEFPGGGFSIDSGSLSMGCPSSLRNCMFFARD